MGTHSLVSILGFSNAYDGCGLFSAKMSQATIAVIGSLIEHITYGVILGVIAVPQAVCVPQ